MRNYIDVTLRVNRPGGPGLREKLSHRMAN